MMVVTMKSIRKLIDRLSDDCKSYNDEAMVMWMAGQLATLEYQEIPDIKWRSMEEIPDADPHKEYLIVGENNGKKSVYTSGFSNGKFNCEWMFEKLIAWAEEEL